MSNLNLTQTDLNQSLRGLTDVDIMMFLPDKSISFPSNAVTMNTKALYNITYGVYLLSAKENGRDNACIINTATGRKCYKAWNKSKG